MHVVVAHLESGEHDRGDAVGGFEQGQQHVFGAHRPVSEPARLLDRALPDLLRLRGEALECGSDSGEPLVRGLLAHPERDAELGPRHPGLPALEHVVVEQPVAELVEPGRHLGGLGELGGRIPVGHGGADGLDEVGERRLRSHESTIS